MNTKVSIIVPVYNVRKYIGKCLDSLINQTLKEIEIIVIDDCGSDNSMDIVQQYVVKDTRIKIFKNSHNLGLAESRNIGLTHAQSEYIAFLDSDDFVECDYYQKLYLAARNYDADMVYSNIAEFYSDDEVIYKNWFYQKLFLDRAQLAETASDKQHIIYACCCWNKLYKKEFLDKFNFQFPKNLYIEDVPYTFMTVMMANKIVAVENAILFYRQRNDSIMSQATKDRKCFDIFKIFNYIEQQMTFYNINSPEYKKILDVHKIAQLWGWYIKCPLKYKTEFLKELKKVFHKIDLEGNEFVTEFENEKYRLILKDITKRRALYIFKYIPIFEIKKENFSKIIKLFNIDIFYKFFDTSNFKVSMFKMPLVFKIKNANIKILYLLNIPIYKKIKRGIPTLKKIKHSDSSFFFSIFTITTGECNE